MVYAVVSSQVELLTRSLWPLWHTRTIQVLVLCPFVFLSSVNKNIVRYRLENKSIALNNYAYSISTITWNLNSCSTSCANVTLSWFILVWFYSLWKAVRKMHREILVNRMYVHVFPCTKSGFMQFGWFGSWIKLN